MNTPNKLTLLRVLLVPLVMVFLLIESIPHRYLWALIVFVAASFTDFLDGNIARKRGLVTTFGKFLDPLADKMLVNAVLICFVQSGLASAAAVVIIIVREFAVTSVRLVASGSGKVIAANIWGKLKTVTQMLSIVAILLLEELNGAGLLGIGEYLPAIYATLIWLSTILTVVSGITYIWDNRQFINTTK